MPKGLRPDSCCKQDLEGGAGGNGDEAAPVTT